MAEPSGPDAGPDPGEVPDTVRIGDDELRFRGFRPGDEQQIVRVLRAGFGGFYPSDKPVDERDYVGWFAEPHDSHLAR